MNAFCIGTNSSCGADYASHHFRMNGSISHAYIGTIRTVNETLYISS